MQTMLALGPFPFSVGTAAYHELRRAMQFKHAAAARVGNRDAFQIVGPGEETIDITGVVAPEVTGTLASITQLEDMGRAGEAYVLIDGTGYFYGTYHIGSLATTQTHHFADGTPRKVEFSLQLVRNDKLPADEPPALTGKSS